MMLKNQQDIAINEAHFTRKKVKMALCRANLGRFPKIFDSLDSQTFAIILSRQCQENPLICLECSGEKDLIQG